MLRLTYGDDGGVVFLTHWGGRRSLAALISKENSPQIGVIDFERLKLFSSFRAAAIVICDVERLTSLEEDRLGRIVSGWRGNGGGLVLNQPPKALRRYALLKTLFQRGINKTDLFRLDDPGVIEQIGFPCFIREESGHHAVPEAPPLLNSRDELTSAMENMKAEGETFYGKLAVEFEDTRSSDGLYAKLSYFRIGDKIIPAHRFLGRNWFLKSFELDLIRERPKTLEEERAFINEEPYREAAKEVFDIAGVDYGRIDFAPRPDGGVHIFEINTNPNMPPDTIPERRTLLAGVQGRVRSAIQNLAKDRAIAEYAWPRDEIREFGKRFASRLGV